MEHLRCVVERITYRNEENGYTVIKCRAKNYADLVAVVGIMPDVHVGSVLSLGGQWRVDGNYGKQFAVEEFEETLPATVYGIEKYLGSGLVKGVGPKFAKRIVERFGKETLSVIDETPDLLIEVEGIGQVRVERIKKSWEEQRVIKNIMLFLQSHDVSTSHATKHIVNLMQQESNINVPVEGLEERISERTGMHYDKIQMDAIRAAVTNKVFILTGGPGTGKTTTTLGIITAFKEAGARILLAAPTGRAAKRLSEATGMEAKTIHRLLEVKPPEGYKHNEEDPLSGDILIVDECSMIDVILMYNLLKAIPDHMSLILVGDADQLPSVGAGNVLSDMMASGVVPMVRLERIFRQAMGSRIITNAHRINKGQSIDLSGGKNADFFFVEREKTEDVVNLIVKYCKENLPRYYKVSPMQDIQVLTPMQRSEIGAVNLNQKLQEALNPGGMYLKRGGVQYRLHDKVMQICNDYDKDVFNGDIGFVSKVDLEERELTVNFEGKDVVYDVSELDELVLAYATTIHKSQGSEYPIVVMPFMMSHYIMLQRNLLYTGVTRAKKIMVLIGQKKAISYAIRNNRAVERNTRLAERLKEW